MTAVRWSTAATAEKGRILIYEHGATGDVFIVPDPGLRLDELEKMLGSAGFDRIKVAPKDTSRSFILEWMPGKGIEEYLVSATIEATKPLHS